MSCDVPAWWRPTFDTMPLEEFIHEQHDVVSRKQWLLAGGSLAELRRRLRRRDWTTVFPGVYFMHRAQPPQSAQDLAALLYAGDDAAWCHETAAARWGLVSPTGRNLSHVLVPWPRRVRRQPGLAVHSSTGVRRLAPGLSPPRVTAAHATLDRVDGCATLDDAYALTADSCQAGQVSAADISRALSVRRVRWGRELRRALGSTLDGSDSLLEVRYVRDVERRHGLPRSTRQRRTGNDIADCAYERYGVLVELDGRLHLLTTRRWRDLSKDNRATLRGEATLRYGWLDVDTRACLVALQVLDLLTLRGYDGPSRPCGPGCPVPRRGCDMRHDVNNVPAGGLFLTW
jgi:very-short-patch-repair endonuclease